MSKSQKFSTKMLTPKLQLLLPFGNCCSASNKLHKDNSNSKVRDKSVDATLKEEKNFLSKSSSKIEYSPLIESNESELRYSFRNNRSSTCSIKSVRFNSVPEVYSIEEEILQSLSPIQTNETEEIEVLGYKGVLLNKNEILNFGGDYKLNNDPNPEIVYKQSNQPIEYEQDIQIRYLKPPTPPPPGDLIIKEEINESNSKPPPPLVIRQQSLLSSSNIQEPIYIREMPPEPPSPVPTQVITIKPKHHHEQSRKVIVERLPPTPRPIVIEKWFL